MSEFEEFEAEEMQNISVKITSKQSEALSELQRRDRYPSRSEAIRAAIRDLIKTIEGKY